LIERKNPDADISVVRPFGRSIRSDVRVMKDPELFERLSRSRSSRGRSRSFGRFRAHSDEEELRVNGEFAEPTSRLRPKWSVGQVIGQSFYMAKMLFCATKYGRNVEVRKDRSIVRYVTRTILQPTSPTRLLDRPPFRSSTPISILTPHTILTHSTPSSAK
jgi:hypothetical protein